MQSTAATFTTITLENTNTEALHYPRCSLTNQKYVPLRKKMILMPDNEDLNIVLLSEDSKQLLSTIRAPPN